jgi:hypothetical protein
MKLKIFGTTLALLFTAMLAGCNEEGSSSAPQSNDSGISGTAPTNASSDAKQNEAGGAGERGGFTANEKGEVKPGDVPKDYPKPEGKTPTTSSEGEKKTGDTAKPADAKPADAKPETEAKPAGETKA